MLTGGRKTTLEHWEKAWSGKIRMRLPSPLNVAVRNMQSLLLRHVRPGDDYLEIGAAPGKLLAWAKARLGVEASGLDFSETGCSVARGLFNALELDIDLRCEDLLQSSFPLGRFDAVASFGLVEHFEDPKEMIRAHVQLVKPGGLALVAIPHYGGLYGRLQRYFDEDNLNLHNLRMMSCSALLREAPHDLILSAKAYPFGRMSPWMVNFPGRWPRSIARSATLVLNGIGLLQPFSIPLLCPLLVLEMRRKSGNLS